MQRGLCHYIDIYIHIIAVLVNKKQQKQKTKCTGYIIILQLYPGLFWKHPNMIIKIVYNHISFLVGNYPNKKHEK